MYHKSNVSLQRLIAKKGYKKLCVSSEATGRYIGPVAPKKLFYDHENVTKEEAQKIVLKALEDAENDAECVEAKVYLSEFLVAPSGYCAITMTVAKWMK